MREQSLGFEQQISVNKSSQSDRLKIKKKYSIDQEQNFSSNTHSFNAFSYLSDQFFFNSSSTFNYSQKNHIDPSTSKIYEFQVNQINNLELKSPQTPSSFGFKGSSFRRANVNICDQNGEKSYKNVQIYMVNDNDDNSKAGLLFKYHNIQIDLKIYKNQGLTLQKNGSLQRIKCQQWMDSLFKWIQVEATIILII